VTAANGAEAGGTATGEVWHFSLYVAGQTSRSLQAFSNLNRLCDAYLPGRYEIEVVDLHDAPERARSDDILAIPTLVRRLPTPLRRIIGDLSDADRVLVGLRLQQTSPG
jgi:circadian clock protein KaiB